MNINLLLLPNRVSLKFASPTERDTFWSTLSKTQRNGFIAARAAERIGNRTIRLHPERTKEGFELPLFEVEGASVPVVAAKPAGNGQNQTSKPVISVPQTVVTQNPFGFKTGAATKPLPGMVPAPPANMLAPPEVAASQEPVEQQDEVGNPLPEAPPDNPGVIPHNAETIAAAEAKPPPPDDNDPKPNVDHRTRVYREWYNRQKARKAKGKM